MSIESNEENNRCVFRPVNMKLEQDPEFIVYQRVYINMYVRLRIKFSGNKINKTMLLSRIIASNILERHSYIFGKFDESKKLILNEKQYSPFTIYFDLSEEETNIILKSSGYQENLILIIKNLPNCDNYDIFCIYNHGLFDNSSMMLFLSEFSAIYNGKVYEKSEKILLLTDKMIENKYNVTVSFTTLYLSRIRKLIFLYIYSLKSIIKSFFVKNKAVKLKLVFDKSDINELQLKSKKYLSDNDVICGALFKIGICVFNRCHYSVAVDIRNIIKFPREIQGSQNCVIFIDFFSKKKYKDASILKLSEICSENITQKNNLDYFLRFYTSLRLRSKIAFPISNWSNKFVNKIKFNEDDCTLEVIPLGILPTIIIETESKYYTYIIDCKAKDVSEIIRLGEESKLYSVEYSTD